MKLRNGVVVLISLVLLGGCAAGGAGRVETSPEDRASSSSPGATYRIGVDDMVAVNVWRDPELSVTMPVRPDGKITVPLIGDVQAGGRTPMEVSADIKRRLSSYVRSPDVTVILTELRSHEFSSRIRVTGAVEHPLSIPYRQGMTALDAVLEAGGLNVYAAPNRAKVYRRDGAADKTRIYDLNLGRILNDGDLSTNISLRPGDVITVPERLF